MSYVPIGASIHFLTNELNSLYLPLDTLTVLEPHPKLRLKSLPVPIGTIPRIILARLIPSFKIYPNTQGMVPSPPQTITRNSVPFPKKVLTNSSP